MGALQSLRRPQTFVVDDNFTHLLQALEKFRMREKLVLRLAGDPEGLALPAAVRVRADFHPREAIEALVVEYARFLFLHLLYPHVRISPSKAVDHVWHEHILFTREYALMCAESFRGFFHHAPTVAGLTEATPGDDSRCYAISLMLYAYEFERPAPPAFWPADDKTRAMMERLRPLTDVTDYCPWGYGSRFAPRVGLVIYDSDAEAKAARVALYGSEAAAAHALKSRGALEHTKSSEARLASGATREATDSGEAHSLRDTEA